MVQFSKIAVVASFILSLSTSAYAADDNWARVGEALGKSGTEMPGGVYRIGLPRTDIRRVVPRCQSLTFGCRNTLWSDCRR